MNKAIIGFVAVGAVIGLRPVVRRIGPGMRKDCKQMLAGQVGCGGETGHSMRDCCEPMTAGQSGDRPEAAGTS